MLSLYSGGYFIIFALLPFYFALNLIIDIGNTACKIAYAEGDTLGKIYRYIGDDVLTFFKGVLGKKRPDVIVLSTVRELSNQIIDYLKASCGKFVVLDSHTELPIANFYKTPETLGPDRIASAVAAHMMFPDENCIVFDFGTAITVDFVSKEGEFRGGNISPGLTTRFKALNHYTKKLPLLENPINISDIGLTTKEAIENGVVLGIMFEVMGYTGKYPDHIVLFTGGDAVYFTERLNHSIFVVYNLVLIGLAQIANYYAHA